MKTFLTSVLALCAGFAIAADPSPDQASIEKLIRSIWDTHETPLTIKPITVVDDYAIAGWAKGEMGGRALLHRVKKHQWAIHRCGGDNIRDLKILQDVGLPHATATQLISAETDAEKGLPRDLRKKFSSFQGLIEMDNHK